MDERRHVAETNRRDTAVLGAGDRVQPSRRHVDHDLGALDQPCSIAQVTSAIVPCPQAVE